MGGCVWLIIHEEYLWKNVNVPCFRKLFCQVLGEKHTETLIDASKEVGLEINVEKTKYMLPSRQQNVGQNRDIEIANRSFENVSQFKYLRTVTKWKFDSRGH
jgi:hypothetical protein